ncbi:PIN-like domain-containing protein [Bacillus cereus]|uniref:PIN-like domain-containing protein n=1 Tax=Bacillus cereus TaxID=1396 RepID=UPI001374BC71|nr:PIN-like domain-containing protein [Bacillus cereus]
MKNELEKLFIKTKTLDEMIKSATVVVDTNVLLSAYQTKPVTFDTILHILQELVDKERLKIPSHVVREFNENRPNRIKEITNELQQFINTIDGIKNTQPPKKLNKILPAIDVLEDSHNEKVIELQQEFNKQLNVLKEQGNAFKEELSALVLKLSDYMDNDPILLKYETIIRESYFDSDVELTEKELEEEGKKRFEKNIPPGFRDKTKTMNKYGDLILWLQICELKEDIVFITFDNKEDWVYKDNKGNVLGARRELVQEYYEKSGGKTVKVLHPGKFIEAYTNENLDKEVKEDLEDYDFNVFINKEKEMQEKNYISSSSKVNGKEILMRFNDRIAQLNNKIYDYMKFIEKELANGKASAAKSIAFRELHSDYIKLCNDIIRADERAKDRVEVDLEGFLIELDKLSLELGELLDKIQRFAMDLILIEN